MGATNTKLYRAQRRSTVTRAAALFAHWQEVDLGRFSVAPYTFGVVASSSSDQSEHGQPRTHSHI